MLDFRMHVVHKDSERKKDEEKNSGATLSENTQAETKRHMVDAITKVIIVAMIIGLVMFLVIRLGSDSEKVIAITSSVGTIILIVVIGSSVTGILKKIKK